MNITWRFFLAPIGLALFGGVVGCSSAARGYCDANADCEREIPVIGVPIPDEAGNEADSVDVCIAKQDGFLRSLRANEEEVCHKVADAYEVYMACIGAAFADEEDGCEVLFDDTPCEDEFDDYADEIADIKNNECSASED